MKKVINKPAKKPAAKPAAKRAVKREHPSKPYRSLFWMKFGTSKDRDHLIENFSLLATSGMSVPESLGAIVQDIQTKRIQDLTHWIIEEINVGTPLWKALGDSGIFPAHMIPLIQIGEESGRLIENLDLIREQQEKDKEFRQKIRSAMMYPMFVFIVTMVVGIGIVWFILPRLALVFAQLSVDLPLTTRILIGFGNFIGAYGRIVVPAFIVGMLTSLYVIFFNPKTKFIGQQLLFWMPGIKRLLKEVELTQFGYIFGTLLDAGVPLTRALASTRDAATLPQYKKIYETLRANIEEGKSFQQSFKENKKSSKLIPIPVQQLIIVGERSGKLSETLLKVNRIYQLKNEATTKNLTVIMEPFLLVMVWLGVLGVALGVILPIYNLIGGFEVG